MRIENIFWVIGIVLVTILFLKLGGFLGIAPISQVEKTPLEAVQELQNNYELANLKLEKNEVVIEYYKNLIGKDQLEYIKKLEERPTKGDMLYRLFMLFICGAFMSFMFTSYYKDNQKEKYKDEMWNRIHKLPNKYQRIFEEKR